MFTWSANNITDLCKSGVYKSYIYLDRSIVGATKEKAVGHKEATAGMSIVRIPEVESLISSCLSIVEKSTASSSEVGCEIVGLNTLLRYSCVVCLNLRGRGGCVVGTEDAKTH
jgi:hypothetical protein